MSISGQRVKRTRWIHTSRYVVSVEIEMVIPLDDPSEPCLEPETVLYLKEVRERAEQGDVDWLKSRGNLYERIDAA